MRAPMRTIRVLAVGVPFVATSLFGSLGCGGGKPPATTASDTTRATHPCGEADKVHKYDLHDEDGDQALVPCSGQGKGDYSGLVHIETTTDGVKISIHASDDDVNMGALGSDVKQRDAVLVYPKGKGEKAVEVPLKHSKDGYTGELFVPFADLGKLTDEGTKIDVAIFDHDDNHTNGAEEMHMSVAISAGKSCEKAIDENPQTMDMGAKGGSKPDLTDAQLGAPMKDSGFFGNCGLANSANADICVAVKEGKPLGVSVAVTPANNKVAACIDKATRKLRFPSSEKLDVVKQHF